MINWNIAKQWENWVTIFLMVAIGMVGLHVFINFIDRD